MVTSRSLRRALQSKPTAVKASAGVLAGVIGMSAAAYGLTQFIQPFKGNGARSAAEARETPGSPSDNLIASLIDIVPSEPLGGGFATDGVLHSLESGSQFVLSIVDGVQPPANGGVTPPPGGGTGGGDGGGNGGGILPWDGGSITPPPGGGDHDGSGMDVPSVNVLPPTVVTPGLGGVDFACPQLAPPPGLAPNLGGSEPAPSEADEADTTGDSCSDDSAESTEASGEEADEADGNDADGGAGSVA